MLASLRKLENGCLSVTSEGNDRRAEALTAVRQPLDVRHFQVLLQQSRWCIHTSEKKKKKKKKKSGKI